MDHDTPRPLFSPEDEPLRRDVGTLGTLLGDVLRDQQGYALFGRVETARHLARRWREGDAGALRDLESSLKDLENEVATSLVEAFSMYFGLVNTAQRVHRMRRRRDYLKLGEPQPGSFCAALRTLRERGVTLEELQRRLHALRVQPVFTAHPTEAVRRTILKKEQRIVRALFDRLDPTTLTPDEDVAAKARIVEEITASFQTEAHHPERPTVGDEVEHVVFYLSEVIYRVVPPLFEALEDAIQRAYGESVEIPLTILRFGSWVGGDMDGNPNVGPATIDATLERHRAIVLAKYRSEVAELFEHLSHSTTRVAVSPALEALLARYRVAFAGALSGVSSRYALMPYRLVLHVMDERLRRTLEDAEGGYGEPSELLADVAVLLESLESNGGRHAGAHRLRRFQRRVATFGFHLAALDVRQDALLHRQAMATLLGDADFPGRAPEERAARIRAWLEDPQRVPDDPEATLGDVLAVMRMLKQARARFGPEATGPYIISMAQGADDALALLALARAADFVDAEGRVPLDVVPLFETVDDLHAGPGVMAGLFGDARYREHVRRRGDQQMVMLGYSDSMKDAGIGASRWSLYQAQEELVAVAEKAAVELSLFHGRGGSVSRGGSQPREGVLAAPRGAVGGRLRLTEQGEIIHSKYGFRGIALRTLELLGGGVLEHFDVGAETSDEQRAMMTRLSRVSREAYGRTGKEDPAFFPYFRTATPIDVIERLPIGSRPASRRSKQGIANLRAIPWVFSWTQSRHMLTGWFGMGTALRDLREDAGLPALRRLAREWRFFATLLSDVEMVMAKADLAIAARYAALAGPEGAPVFATIEAEYATCAAEIQGILGNDRLLDGEPQLQRNIQLRRPYVDPISFVQLDLLARWRAKDRDDPELLEALFTTVLGIARGLQNTG